MKRIVSLLLICVMCIHLYPCTVKASTESNLIKYDIDAMHDQAMDYYKRYASEHTEHLDFALISVAAAVYKYQAVFVYPIECVDGIKYEMVMCFSTDQDMTYTCSEGSAHVTGFLQCRFIFEKDDYSSFQYTYCLAPTTAYFSLTKKLPIEALKKYNNFKLTYNNDVDKTYEYRAPANLFNTMTQAVLESSYFKLDSDHDGLPDVMEINGIAVSDDERITTNPFDKHSDKDGLTDGEELVLAPVDQKTPVTPINYKVTKISDPTKEDTDGDGLDDGYEVKKSKTDPMKPDTDWDGLNDGYEGKPSKTDPLKADTDKDGAIDSRDRKPLEHSDRLYNRESAFIYSQMYYKEYNNDYPAMKYGDCANFVSQCIYAGGLEMNDEWHMRRIGIFDSISLEPHNLSFSWSKTWTIANEQYHYFKDNYGVETYRIDPDDSISEFLSNHDIQKGELLYFNEPYESEDQDVHHASIISAIEDDDIFYAAHTRSYQKQSLTSKIVEVYQEGEHKGERIINYVYIIKMSDAL